MKRIMYLIAIFMSVFPFTHVYGQQVSLEKVTLGTVYVPIGFDNINRSQVMVEGVFKDTCYRIASHTVQINGNTIVITQGANVYQGLCADVLVPFSQVVELGILKIGNYSIVDGATGRELG